MTCEGNVCGTGGWAGPLPGDPSNDINITALPAYGGIDVSFSFPTTNPFALAYGIIFRGLSADFAAALPIANDSDGFYHDRVEPGVIYYYWVQAVSINGTLGEVIGPAWSDAKSSIEGVMRDLTGQIDAGFLAQSLKTEIERIPQIDFSLLQEIQDRIDSNVALQTALSAVQSDVDQAMTYILDETTARTNADSATVNQINAIAAGIDGNAAAIVEERTVRATRDDALASDISVLYTKTGNNEAAILSEQTARTNADGALSQRVDSVVATANTKNKVFRQPATPVATATNDLWFDSDDGNRAYRWTGTVWEETADTRIASNQAAIQTEQTARADADSALSTRIDTVLAKANDNAAAIVTEQTARANQDTALANQINTVQSQLSSDITAAVQVETNARVSADNALSSQITTVESTLNGNISQAEVRLQTNINAVDTKASNAASAADAASIQAGSANTAASNAQTAANNAQGTANTANSKANNIGALYTVKLNVNGLIGGFGTYNDGNTVQMGFDVDSFWVGRTNADKIKPFIISGGTTYINEAVINSLTFSKLRADDGSVIVEGGKLKANYIQAKGLSVVDDQGNLNFLVGLDGKTTLGGAFKRGQTSYDNGTGWFFDIVNGVPVMSIGRGPTGPALLFNGTDVIIRGLAIEKLDITIGGSYSSSVANGTQFVGTASVSVTGGVGPYTYNWSLSNLISDIDPAEYSYSIETPDSPSTRFKGYGYNNGLVAQLQLVVTDSRGLIGIAYKTHSVHFGAYQ